MILDEFNQQWNFLYLCNEEVADEAYAMENGSKELKQMATKVLGDNNSDSVAKWLGEYAVRESK